MITFTHTHTIKNAPTRTVQSTLRLHITNINHNYEKNIQRHNCMYLFLVSPLLHTVYPLQKVCSDLCTLVAGKSPFCVSREKELLCTPFLSVSSAVCGWAVTAPFTAGVNKYMTVSFSFFCNWSNRRRVFHQILSWIVNYRFFCNLAVSSCVSSKCFVMNCQLSSFFSCNLNKCRRVFHQIV